MNHERERDMALSTRSPRTDPQLVSFPPSLQQRKQAAAKMHREASGWTRQPGQEAARSERQPRQEAAGSATQPPLNRAACAGAGVGSPVAGLHPATCVRTGIGSPVAMLHQRRFKYHDDLWTKVARHLSASDLIRLSCTCSWFLRLLAHESIWRHLFFRDFDLPAAKPDGSLQHSWRRLYSSAFDHTKSAKSHAFHFREIDKHLDSTELLLTGKLPLPRWLQPIAESRQLDIETTGACMLTNARPGIWIADAHLVRCLGCKVSNCKGDMLVLDVWHAGLFLEAAYLDGTLQYEDLGEHSSDQEAAAIFSAVFNLKHMDTPSATCVVDTGSWSKASTDFEPQTRVTKCAAAVHANRQSNRGFVCRFQAMADANSGGQILSIRILLLLRA